MRRVVAVVVLVVLFVFGAADCTKKKIFIPDGDPCTATDECHSHQCRDGICRGSTCTCPGTTCADCSPGWRCEARDRDWVERGVDSWAHAAPTFECYAPCGICPRSTKCDATSGLCKYVEGWSRPTVVIDAPDGGPFVTPGNVAFHATGKARDGGRIVSYAWTTSTGGTASGPTATFSITVDTTVTVTVTDDLGVTAVADARAWPTLRP